MRRISISIFSFCLLAASLFGCDSVAPVDDTRLVVEGYLEAGRPLPEVEVRRTLSPTSVYDEGEAAVIDADVQVLLDGQAVRYVADSLQPGTYRPVDSLGLIVGPDARFDFRAEWRGSVASVEGSVPPAVKIADVSLTIPDEAVSAVLLDSLDLSDTLATGAYTGYIYPIEVTVEWESPTDSPWPMGESWIRAQLKPISLFSSPVVDLFLRSDAIVKESDQVRSSGRFVWTGVYAVGVAEQDMPLPEHQLRVALVRSGSDYARYAASKDSPERREPISNVTGGVGIFAALSLDTTHVNVYRSMPDRQKYVQRHE